MSILKRLRRALSAGVRELKEDDEEEEATPPPKAPAPVLDCKPRPPSWFDRESRNRASRAQRASLNKPSLPLEGIEGRDKWIRENFSHERAERVINALGHDPNGDFNSLDALLTVNRRVAGEEYEWDYGRGARKFLQNEEKFIQAIGVDFPAVNQRLKEYSADQINIIVARANGRCCWFRHEEYGRYSIEVPEDFPCCEKEKPAEWELTQMDGDMEVVREGESLVLRPRKGERISRRMPRRTSVQPDKI